MVFSHDNDMYFTIILHVVFLMQQAVIVVPISTAEGTVTGQSLSDTEDFEEIIMARCEAICYARDGSKRFNMCVKQCLKTDFKKPGNCPAKGSPLYPFASVCMDTCYKDSQCSDVTKCCPHKCGVTCQHPHHLDDTSGLPGIPQAPTVTETPHRGPGAHRRRGARKRALRISWRSGDVTNSNTTARLDNHPSDYSAVIYVLEQRHYYTTSVGKRHSEDGMDSIRAPWTPCGRTRRRMMYFMLHQDWVQRGSHRRRRLNANSRQFNIETVENTVKPGRWYEFRVAAVNENGTKGFSNSSYGFMISIGPKAPKAPTNVTVTPLWSTNGTVYLEMHWTPPISDLPIDRYKVFWSRRLQGATALDSVLVEQQTISKDKTTFLLKRLQINSLYFLQVQALVQFGKNILKGTKSGFVLNTTNLTNDGDYNQLLAETIEKSRIDDLFIERVYWSQNDLKARINWKPTDNNLKYTITWCGNCKKVDFNGITKVKLNSTTKQSYFDLYDLKFNCRYKVTVREIKSTIYKPKNKSTQDTFINFTTPSCLEFKKTNKKVICN